MWTAERLLRLIHEIGLRLEDIRVARRNGSIAGVMGLWDQSAYKQNVVRSLFGMDETRDAALQLDGSLLMWPFATAATGREDPQRLRCVRAVAEDVAVFQRPACRYDENAPPHAVSTIFSWDSMSAILSAQRARASAHSLSKPAVSGRMARRRTLACST